MKYNGLEVKLTKEREEIISAGWERRRIESMLANVKDGDIVFDIGAEQGDMTAMLAVKTGKVVPFECSPMMWPHIRENLERNGIKPLDCYVGFVSNETIEKPKLLNYDDKMRNGYPECAYSEIENTRGFRHLDEEADATKQIKLDDYCKRTNIWPDMVTIDVEGSEYEVLEGMNEVMNKAQPIVYISIHHDFLYDKYKRFFNDIAFYFAKWQYKSQYLGFDHEAHFVFYKKSLIEVKEILE